MNYKRLDRADDLGVVVYLEFVLNSFIVIWPLLIGILSVLFYRKQNSKQAWTGGSISWPKAIWLFYTVLTWFIYPLLFVFHPDVSSFYVGPLVIHLISWWIRGPLELIMIYKWLNWKPLYGISHDLFHLLLMIVAVGYFQSFDLRATGMDAIAQLLLASIFLSTLAETYFAFRFRSLRSQEETDSHVYFASTDGKWKRVNQLTAAVVLVLMTTLCFQSILLVRASI